MREVDSELFNAVRQGYISEVEKCIDKGASVNAKDIDGKTPLSIAREEGYSGVAIYLAGRMAEMFYTQGALLHS